MGTNLHNSYLFKALDAYPYCLEETMEALNYALSYNNKDVLVLCLMGRVHAEQLQNYTVAKQYFEEALSESIDTPQVYSHYVQALIWNDDYNEAEKLIAFALTVKGVDVGLMLLKKGQLYEAMGKYKLALVSLKDAKKEGLNNDFVEIVNNEIARVKRKVKPKKKKVKKEKNVIEKKKSKLFLGLF